MTLDDVKSEAKVLLSMLYPQGSDNIPREQWRDVVRIYAAAAFTTVLMLAEQNKILKNQIRNVLSKSWMEDYEAMAPPDWWPDESWSWPSNPDYLQRN